jgi:hypothetical protein
MSLPSKPRKVVACKHCGDNTPMLGTQLCDPCWLMERHIASKPDAAQKILDAVLERRNLTGNTKLLQLCMLAIEGLYHFLPSMSYVPADRALEQLKQRGVTPQP